MFGVAAALRCEPGRGISEFVKGYLDAVASMEPGGASAHIGLGSSPVTVVVLLRVKPQEILSSDAWPPLRNITNVQELTRKSHRNSQLRLSELMTQMGRPR